ncbi:hypothetical protein PR003_g15606 [Phytophthora rubi]|uniref:Uncharacterized protein n=1 Tax=Phytophthora rubi TaxID=129364 RepID=A0A6A4EXX9_9STRA|nr:hypothetical protein PR003_g15606 [Phytophthora rubi]
MAARPRTPSRNSTLVGGAAATAAFLAFTGFLALSLSCSSFGRGWSSGGPRLWPRPRPAS